jgi:tRNA-specific 2-thiouridylase
VRVTAKIRYKASEADATLYPRGDDAVIQFDQPQRAVTPGQAVAFYQGNDLLGGGIIEGAYAFAGGPVHSAALSTARV